jgi:glycosyltransferase involved in cell wall biosynthesis
MPKIRLLLMPSRSQEAWGRTATEAQICGIPVLGSSRGNLPLTIGSGGMTLDPDEPIERWLEAFDRIMDDPAVYEELSRQAFARGQALTQEVHRAYQAFERVLLNAAARRGT